MSKERRLGRGLEALLGRVPAKPETPEKPSPAPAPAPSAGGGYGGKVETAYGTPDPYAETALDPSPAVDASLSAESIETGQMQTVTAAALAQATASSARSDSGPPRVPIRQIESNPFQPREDFSNDSLQSLADSLRAHGLLQPVVVRRIDGGRCQLVAGERRLRAATKAGWTDVPVQIIEADDRQMAELAIVENLQREDLNPLEKAASFQRYLEHYGCTQEELASRLKLDRSTIANLIRLLELPEGVKDAVRQGRITQGHARALLPLGDEPEQVALCERIQKEGMSVRQTEATVREAIDRADAEPLSVVSDDGDPSSRPSPNEHVASLEQEFRSALGTKVKLTHSARGRGKLTIHFSNHEEFERLRSLLCHPGGPTLKSKVG